MRWDEVDERLEPAEFGMQLVLERVERNGDLARRPLQARQRLPAALMRLG